MDVFVLAKKAFQFPTIISIRDLKHEWRYPIIEWRDTDTKYGRAILVTLMDDEDEQISVYLPKRVTATLTKEHIQELNSSSESVFLVARASKHKHFNVAIERDE